MAEREGFRSGRQFSGTRGLPADPRLTDAEPMEFRLVLRGALPPHKRGTTDAKHRIRQELHPQLRAFWRWHPLLKDRWTAVAGDRPLVEQYADEYPLSGCR